MSKFAANEVCKQDQGHASSAEGITDTALRNREQRLRVYTSRVIEHEKKNNCDSWTEVVMELLETKDHRDSKNQISLR